MTVFKCKPITASVTAIRFDGDNEAEVAEFAGINNRDEVGLYRHFSNGARRVGKGDFVVRSGGELLVLDEHDFKLRFEMSGGEPEANPAPVKKESTPKVELPPADEQSKEGE
ncbi:hypothetical protein JXVLWARM_CDS_0007 [Burkholderia phage Bm1]